MSQCTRQIGHSWVHSGKAASSLTFDSHSVWDLLQRSSWWWTMHYNGHSWKEGVLCGTLYLDDFSSPESPEFQTNLSITLATSQPVGISGVWTRYQSNGGKIEDMLHWMQSMRIVSILPTKIETPWSGFVFETAWALLHFKNGQALTLPRLVLKGNNRGRAHPRELHGSRLQSQSYYHRSGMWGSKMCRWANPITHGCKTLGGLTLG